MKRALLSLPIILGFLCAPLVHAQNTSSANPDRNKPLEITADESLEWHRNDLYFRARKNVVAKQGATTLKAALLTAKYREGEKSGMDIHTIQANGNVQIISAQTNAYGDKATYNVDKGYAVMTGKGLRLVSEDQTVTARDKFQYWVNQGRLEAVGNAQAKREGDTLKADKIIAIFAQDKTGKRKLKTLEAVGNVEIITPSEVLTGARAMYKAQTNVAEITGDVNIKRGPNTLKGARGEVNLETNISKIFGSGENSTGRVSGVFYPGSETKPAVAP